MKVYFIHRPEGYAEDPTWRYEWLLTADDFDLDPTGFLEREDYIAESGDLYETLDEVRAAFSTWFKAWQGTWPPEELQVEDGWDDDTE